MNPSQNKRWKTLASTAAAPCCVAESPRLWVPKVPTGMADTAMSDAVGDPETRPGMAMFCCHPLLCQADSMYVIVEKEKNHQDQNYSIKTGTELLQGRFTIFYNNIIKQFSQYMFYYVLTVFSM